MCQQISCTTLMIWSIAQQSTEWSVCLALDYYFLPTSLYSLTVSNNKTIFTKLLYKLASAKWLSDSFKAPTATSEADRSRNISISSTIHLQPPQRTWAWTSKWSRKISWSSHRFFQYLQLECLCKLILLSLLRNILLQHTRCRVPRKVALVSDEHIWNLNDHHRVLD